MATTKPAQIAQTKVLETLAIKGQDKAKLEGILGRPLGSPINGKQEGDEFEVTLTGKIEIREFQGVKGAYFLTKEGYSIKVNASFDPTVQKEGAKLNAVCRVLNTTNTDGTPREVKFCAFAA